MQSCSSFSAPPPSPGKSAGTDTIVSCSHSIRRVLVHHSRVALKRPRPSPVPWPLRLPRRDRRTQHAWRCRHDKPPSASASQQPSPFVMDSTLRATKSPVDQPTTTAVEPQQNDLPPDPTDGTTVGATVRVLPSAQPHPVAPQPTPYHSSFSGLSLLLLNLVTVLWGTQHAVIKLLVDSNQHHELAAASALAPPTLNFLRFALAATVCLPFLPRRWKSIQPALLPGAELGLWMFLGYAAQAVGLLSTSASRSGFLLYLNVKLVPIFAALFYRRKISSGVWASAITAFAGTALLSYDGAPPNTGDFFSILAAAASAMFILRMERASTAQNAKPAAINTIALLVVASLTGVWCWATALMHDQSIVSLLKSASWFAEAPSRWLPVLYLGVVTTALTNWLQAVAQRSVPAERAAVIFAMDPVYGAIFANLLLGEQFGIQGFIGAALIVAAAVGSNYQTSMKQ